MRGLRDMRDGFNIHMTPRFRRLDDEQPWSPHSRPPVDVAVPRAQGRNGCAAL